MTQNTDDFNRILEEINRKIDYMSEHNDRESISSLLKQVESLERAFNTNMMNFNFEKDTILQNIQNEIAEVIEKSAAIQELFPKEEDDSRFEDIEEKIDSSFEKYNNDLSSLIKEDYSAVAQAIGSLYSKLENLQDNIEDRSAIDEVREEINKISTKIYDLKDELCDNSAEETSEIIENIKENNNTLIELGTSVTDNLRILNDNIQKTREDSEEFKTQIEDTLNTIGGNIDSRQSQIEDNLSQVAEAVLQSVETNNAIKDELHEDISSLGADILEIKNNAENNLTIITTGIQQGIDCTNTMQDKIREDLDGITESLRENIDNTAFIQTKIDENINKFEENIASLNENIEKTGEISDNIHQVMESLEKTGEDLNNFKENIAENLGSYLSSIKELFINFSEEIHNNQENISYDVLDKQIEKTDEIIKNIEELTVTITEKEENYKESIDEKFQELYEYLKKLESDVLSNTENSNGDVEKLTDYIQETSEKLNEIFAGLSSDYSVNSSKIDELKEVVTEKINNLDSKFFVMEGNIANKLNNNVFIMDQLKGNIGMYINSSFDEIKSVLSSMSSISSNLSENIFQKVTEMSSGFVGKISEITERITETTDLNNTLTIETKQFTKQKVDEIQQDISKLEEIFTAATYNFQNTISEIRGIKDAVAFATTKIDSLADNENCEKIGEQIVSLEEKFTENAEHYENLFGQFQERFNEYINNVELISEDSDKKFAETAEVFTELKSSLEEIREVLYEINVNKDGALDNNISEIIRKIDNVSAIILENREGIKSDVQDVIREHITFVDKGLEYLTMNFYEIKTNLSDNEFRMTETVTNRINDVKQEIELLNNDIEEICKTKADAIIKEFEPLKNAIIEFTSFDFQAVADDLKNQIEISYLNLLQELNQNIIKNHDTYINIENTYKDVVSRCEALKDCIDEFVKNNMDKIHSAINDMDTNIRSNIEKTGEFISEWKTYTENLDKKLLQNKSDTERSLINLLGKIQTAIEEKINAGSNDLKDFLAVVVNNEDLMLTLESINEDIVHEIQTIKTALDEKNNNIEKSLLNINNNINEKLAAIQLELTVNSTEDDSVTQYANTIKLLFRDLEETISSKLEENSFASNDKTVDEISKLNESLKALHLKLDVFAADDNSTLEEEVIELSNSTSEIANKLEELHSKVDVLAMNDSSDIQEELAELAESGSDIAHKIDELHNKIDVISLNDTSDFEDEFAELAHSDLKIAQKIEELHSKIDILAANDSSDIQDELSELAKRDEKISKMLDDLHSKVDILAMSDDSEIREEIIKLQDMLKEKFDNNHKSNDIEISLSKLMDEINKIDLEKNTNDIKDSVMSAILSVSDQLSFVEETEEIKDFVEEKTNEIHRTLNDVKKQLGNISSNSDDMDFYSYTLQDVESDIAKLRLAITELSSNDSSNEVGVISSNINRIAKSIEDLQFTVNSNRDDELNGDFDKLNEDILSISARTNKLLLNSDESYRILSESMEEFNRRTDSLEEQINAINSKNLEKRLAVIDKKVNATMNSSKVLENVMMYLGEWMDGTTDLVNSIYDKSAKTTSIQAAIDELKTNIPQKQELLNIIENKFEEQQSRIDKLEQKLEQALTLLQERQNTNVLDKIDNIESQLEKLSGNMEKLTAYVD